MTANSFGFIKLHRHWFAHALFERDVYSRREAFLWLIAHACWKAKTVNVGGVAVPLERGQLSYSFRFLAEAWGWVPSAVFRFFKTLENWNLIETQTETGQTIVTICEYEAYQGQETDGETAQAAKAERLRNTGGTNKKKDKKDKTQDSYVYQGKVIQLCHGDYARWERSFKHVDLEAELTGLDAYYAGLALKDQKMWFARAAAALAKKNAAALMHKAHEQEADEETRLRQDFPDWDAAPPWLKDERRKRGRPRPG